ncbi:hypothetical protein BC628DRAFT_831470 [Trametes gibbosa]|nr:hypothetical protein BC628DRAFT_831470 [Trametes gibbosa]
MRCMEDGAGHICQHPSLSPPVATIAQRQLGTRGLHTECTRPLCATAYLAPPHIATRRHRTRTRRDRRTRTPEKGVGRCSSRQIGVCPCLYALGKPADHIHTGDSSSSSSSQMCGTAPGHDRPRGCESGGGGWERRGLTGPAVPTSSSCCSGREPRGTGGARRRGEPARADALVRAVECSTGVSAQAVGTTPPHPGARNRTRPAGHVRACARRHRQNSEARIFSPGCSSTTAPAAGVIRRAQCAETHRPREYVSWLSGLERLGQRPDGGQPLSRAALLPKTIRTTVRASSTWCPRHGNRSGRAVSLASDSRDVHDRAGTRRGASDWQGRRWRASRVRAVRRGCVPGCVPRDRPALD